MKRKPFCCDCDASKRLYADYYGRQSGGNVMPVFVGRRYQRAHGLAQTIGGLLKRIVVPFVAPHAKRIGKQILDNVAKTGMEVVGDVMEGKGRSAKEAIKERGLSGIKRTVDDIVRQSPFNVGNAATAQPLAAKKAKKATKKKKKVIVKPGGRRDIFA